MSVQRWSLPRCFAHLNKVIYKNEVVAHQAIMQLPRSSYKGNLHFYKCPVLNHWHIGHVMGEQK